MGNKKFWLPVMAFTMLAASCQTGGDKLKSGIQVENMDTTVAPGADFYRYACGTWIKNHPLTAEYARYGTFDALIENNQKQLRELIEEIASGQHQQGTLQQKIASMFNCVMDSTRQNELGMTPIAGQLKEIYAAPDKKALFDIVARNYTAGVPTLFGFYIGADVKNSSMNLLEIYQSGLTLGEKEYYLENDEATVKVRDAFKTYLHDLFILCGQPEAESARKAADVLRIETRMAGPSYSATQRRDPEANYHKMSYDSLVCSFPGIDWNRFFELTGVSGLQELSVGQPEPVAEAGRIWQEESLEALKNYTAWTLMDAAANCLSDEFRACSFAFYGKAMSGREEERPRWKRAVSAVNGALGEAVGQMYVEKYFPAAAKERMVTLVRNLQTALGERIQQQDWMSDETKKRALEKLETFHVKVGYPDKWRDYTALEIGDDYWQNSMNCSRFGLKNMIDEKLGKPVDRDEWFMTPQTVNAYYNPTTNEICFPAGILQYPFFDMESDDAFNYGAIGVVIGHEMTHGFDDSGRQFDKDGNLCDWWAEGDAERFDARAKVMEDYFNAIEVLPGLKANGKLTLGENLADHGGLMVAYQAFKNATAAQPLADKDGFTPEQRFFLAYANLWAGNIRDEEIRNLTKSDPHSLGRWRVNGALPHIDAWYEAFGITEQDSMFVPQSERARIW